MGALDRDGGSDRTRLRFGLAGPGAMRMIGRMKIVSAEFVTSALELERCPREGLPEFAFIGRSNVGKSSLLNALMNRRELAKVSGKPGATQTINFYRVNGGVMLADLPGYGYSRTSQEQRDDFRGAVSSFLTGRDELRCVFVLVDSRLEPQRLDLEFCDWLAQSGVPFVLVFTKSDKLKAAKVKANVAAFLEALKERVDGEPRHFVTSAKTKDGRDPVWDFIKAATKAA